MEDFVETSKVSDENNHECEIEYENECNYNESHFEQQFPGMGDTNMNIVGIVTYVANELSSNSIVFKVQVKSVSNDILCKYHYTEYYPLLERDMVSMDGCFDAIIFNGKNQECFSVDNMTARYEFDLANFLADTFPNLQDSESLKMLATKIGDYGRDYYAPGPEGVAECLNHLSGCLHKNSNEVEDFTEYVYGRESFFVERVKSMKKFLARYLSDGLKRPFQLLGISDDEINAICIPLYDAYKIAVENPFRIPEISMDRAIKICKNHLRIEEIPAQWTTCGEITRFVYRNLTRKGWTSTPVKKLEASFPRSFSKYRQEVCNNYQCIEELDHFYYIPIRRKEEMVANYMANLFKAPKNDPLIPIYAGAEPSEEQDNAIRGALVNRASIIHGPAGTGKTKTLGHIAQTLVRAGFVPMFVAFTGVAVQRIKKSLEECDILNKCKVMTIHMAISMQSMLTDLSVSHVIFDEFSMVDLSLFCRFICAFSRLKLSYIFTGDINQLEPISYGNVMAELLKTPIAIYKLTKNFRSEEGILTMINEVVDEERLKKQAPINWHRNFPDFQYYNGGIEMLTQFIKFQYDEFTPTFEDEEQQMYEFLEYRDKLTIVCPYKKICAEVNDIFQSIFMEQFPFQMIDGRKFHLYDRVMKLVNNYSIEVMNGEVGRVTEIHPDYIVVQFRENDKTSCPFFSKHRLKKTKEIKNALGVSFTPYEKDENGTKIEKQSKAITEELTKLKEKFSKMVGKTFNQADVAAFFDVAIQFPFAMFGMSGESEFLSLSSIQLAYAVTTHKSQGDQFLICLFFLCGIYSSFVSYRNIYTGLSRAKKRLILMSEGESLINSATLTPGKFTYENLARRINSKLPEELRIAIPVSDEPVDEFADMDFDGDDFDTFDDFAAYM